MSQLNRDVLYLIFEQLENDTNTLRSCLLVNKTWCETIIPILWKNPWKRLNLKNGKFLKNVIISQLSDTSRYEARKHRTLRNFRQKTSFNYISYCRHLNLDKIMTIFAYEKLKIKTEVLNLFVSENMKYTHFYIYKGFNSQLDFICEVEDCYSGIEFLSCNNYISNKAATKLAETCKSIKKLELSIEKVCDNYEIIKLIEAQTKLFDVSLNFDYKFNSGPNRNISFCELQNSLIKHASTIQYCKINKPLTKLLSSLTNLKRLEFNRLENPSWNCLVNKSLSFPFLQTLKSSDVPTEVSTNIIKSTKGSLIEINIDRTNDEETSNKKLIQAVYQNCPNIKYLKLMVRNCNILELETLLISCKYLNVLYIIIYDIIQFDWNKLFEILTKSSPNSLFKFKIYIYNQPNLEIFKSFFDNWKGRHPIFLQILYGGSRYQRVFIDPKIIEKYKEDGIIEKFDYGFWWEQSTGDFEWI